MSAEEGALVEPVSVAVNICRVADLRGGQTVIVFGCGPIGVLCQAVAKAHGASRVIGVDISKSRAAFAKDFAADGVYVVNRDALSKGSAVAADPVDAARVLGESIVKQLGLGEGADVVLEATGAEQCIQAGIFACHPGGTYVQAGMGKEASKPNNNGGKFSN
jgi:D-xylulose reductase